MGLHAARIIRARVLLISDQKTAFLYNICRPLLLTTHM